MTYRGIAGRLVALVVLIGLASACGARVTDEQRAAATGGVTLQPGAANGQASQSQTGSVRDAGERANGAPDASSSPGLGSGQQAGVAAASGPVDNGGATDVGVTPDSITLGVVASLSGPIPGLFQGAVVGGQAFIAYVNSQGGMFGRKLKLEVRDDQLDAGQNRAQTQDLSGKVLAMLGSFSTADDAGAPILEKAGIPDIGYGLTDARRSSPVNFSIQPAKSGTFRTGPFLYYGKKFPDAVKAMGAIYGDVPASKGGFVDSKAAAESVGWKFVYERGYQPTESDFTADVVRMRQSGVKGIYIVASDAKNMARLAKAMAQQNWKPDFVAFGASGYDANLIALGGDAVEGVYVDQQQALYQGGDAQSVPEVGLMNQWIQKVKPGFKPDLYTAFAWASGRLLVQAMQDAGPKVTRAGLIAALRKIDNFDANGLMAPAGPASKRQATCDLFMQVRKGQFVRVDPPDKGFMCGGGTIFQKVI
jgi:ABC-type branched-subunit amino acid transport system substrate-binding protein